MRFVLFTALVGIDLHFHPRDDSSGIAGVIFIALVLLAMDVWEISKK